LVSGGCDSKIVVWVDKTEETKLELAAANQEKVMKEQELANLLKSEDLLNALRLALSLERPATVLKIIQGSVLFYFFNM
jgi:UTP:GlnB (protein PII) uridylyltransferase